MFEITGLDLSIFIVFLTLLLLIWFLPRPIQQKYMLVFGAGSSLLGGLIAFKLEPFFKQIYQF